jgi:hypothetical protein
MELFEDIQRKEFEHLTGEIGALGRRLVELGWSREQVLAYVTQLLNESMDTTSGDPDAGKEEDGARGTTKEERDGEDHPARMDEQRNDEAGVAPPDVWPGFPLRGVSESTARYRDCPALPQHDHPS